MAITGPAMPAFEDSISKDIVMQCQKLVPSSNINFSIEDKGRGTFCHSLSKANKENSNQPIPKPNKNYHHHHQQSEQEENNLFILHEK